jgi:EVE domain
VKAGSLCSGPIPARLRVAPSTGYTCHVAQSVMWLTRDVGTGKSDRIGIERTTRTTGLETLGMKGAFMQLNHGRQAPLRRLTAGDGVIMYSPRTAYPDGEPLQAFTAIGTVVTGDVYQVQVTPDFQPHRVDVQFVPSRAAHIKPLVEHLSFITSKSRWGAAFRFGL